MNEDFSEYKNLTQLMEAAPQVNSPAGFTERVMARVQVLDQGIWSQVRRALLNPTAGSIYSGLAQKLSVSSPRECSFYFFITGFFYLIIGIILMSGFKGISSSMAAMDWIRLQPHLTLGIAVWLLVLGIVLLMEGNNTIKLIRFGTLFYIFLAIVNGGLMHLYFSIPYAGIFVFGFIGAGVIMGVMLALAVQKVELRPV